MVTHKLKEKAASIKLVVTDCDGVLTDGCAWYSDAGEAMKRFSLRDGMGVERLRKLAGIETAIITGENTQSVRRRAEKLNIKYLYQGISDKSECLTDLASKLGLALSEIAYIGDDVNDLPAIDICGFSGAPSDAFEDITEKVDYITLRSGGNGAFREFAEFIIKAQIENKDSDE